jgi:hypothetical protein
MDWTDKSGWRLGGYIMTFERLSKLDKESLITFPAKYTVNPKADWLYSGNNPFTSYDTED